MDVEERVGRFRRAAGRGETVDWGKLLAGYRATVDWPSAQFWRDLAEKFPAAKIVLTVRDGPVVLGVPVLPALGLLGYLLAVLNSLWIVYGIWRSGRE